MKPTYDLSHIQECISERRFVITGTATDGAAELGFGAKEIVECIVNQLNASHFYKTMPADKAPGFWQDVYLITYCQQRLYIKLQINARGKAVIISFKEDTS